MTILAPAPSGCFDVVRMALTDEQTSEVDGFIEVRVRVAFDWDSAARSRGSRDVAVFRTSGPPRNVAPEIGCLGGDQAPAFGLDEALVAVGRVAVADVVGHRLGKVSQSGWSAFLTTNSPIPQKWHSMRLRKLA